jgi:hypothetical protein
MLVRQPDNSLIYEVLEAEVCEFASMWPNGALPPMTAQGQLLPFELVASKTLRFA